MIPRKNEGDENMAMFDREEDELIPLLYMVGDKIMVYESSDGIDMLIGGTVVEVRQSTSHLYDNYYNVELEAEVVAGACKGTWWVNGKGVKPLKLEAWNRAKHWKESRRLKEKSFLEQVRMLRALKEENDEIEDEELMKEIIHRQ